MRILVCGDRDWTDHCIIQAVVNGFIPAWLQAMDPESSVEDQIVIHGDARGADTIAGRFARRHPALIEVAYPADWDSYGRSAGPIRNTQMLKEGMPDVVLAFHDDIKSSKGTAHMVRIAKKAGVPTYVISRA